MSNLDEKRPSIQQEDQIHAEVPSSCGEGAGTGVAGVSPYWPHQPQQIPFGSDIIWQWNITIFSRCSIIFHQFSMKLGHVHAFFMDCSWIFHCQAKWPEIFSTCR
jgi:hypothetical protein